MSTEVPVDRRSRKPQALQAPCRSGVRTGRTIAEKLIQRTLEPVLLRAVATRHARLRGLALDAPQHELADEPSIADRFPATFDVQAREQRVVEVPFALAPRHGRANLVVVELLLREAPPEL